MQSSLKTHRDSKWENRMKMLLNPIYYTGTNVSKIDDPGWQYLTPNFQSTKIVHSSITIPMLKFAVALFRPNLAFSLALRHIGRIFCVIQKVNSGV